MRLARVLPIVAVLLVTTSTGTRVGTAPATDANPGVPTVDHLPGATPSDGREGFREPRVAVPPPRARAARSARPAPVPAPPRPPAPPPPGPVDPGGSGVARALAVLDADVPAAWRAAIAPRVESRSGNTSWARTDGVLEFGNFHLAGDWQHLRTVVTHEFGHLIAYRYGSQAFLGAAPPGFGYAGPHPEEMWADCVARAVTGNVDPSHGLEPCGGAPLEFARAFLAAGPAAHARTG
jgi:hypothetical protein